ncbi:hypothetical protein MSAN_02131900 [Mycena sanguinolenta]|uniref:Uncharacterized protein n=1 Tax=Mycena sanguinolenta TaxID=230812 RepID=A0A8H6XH56_9AGAR|nr:hypothetical protein MSAN_02131900 [Mycena sanguinolenta]
MFETQAAALRHVKRRIGSSPACSFGAARLGSCVPNAVAEPPVSPQRSVDLKLFPSPLLVLSCHRVKESRGTAASGEMCGSSARCGASPATSSLASRYSRRAVRRAQQHKQTQLVPLQWSRIHACVASAPCCARDYAGIIRRPSTYTALVVFKALSRHSALVRIGSVDRSTAAATTVSTGRYCSTNALWRSGSRARDGSLWRFRRCRIVTQVAQGSSASARLALMVLVFLRLRLRFTTIGEKRYLYGVWPWRVGFLRRSPSSLRFPAPSSAPSDVAAYSARGDSLRDLKISSTDSSRPSSLTHSRTWSCTVPLPSLPRPPRRLPTVLVAFASPRSIFGYQVDTFCPLQRALPLLSCIVSTFCLRTECGDPLLESSSMTSGRSLTPPRAKI